MDSFRSLLLAGTCVAALAAAGCSSGNSDSQGTASPTSSDQGTTRPSDPYMNPTAPSEPAVPPRYDELTNWSSGETDESMTAVGKLMGVTDLTFPFPDLVEQGWVGVAPFEKYCIIGFRTVGESTATDKLSATVLSRYNIRLTILISGGTPAQLKPSIDKAREYCKTATVTLPPQATTTTA